MRPAMRTAAYSRRRPEVLLSADDIGRDQTSDHNAVARRGCQAGVWLEQLKAVRTEAKASPSRKSGPATAAETLGRLTGRAIADVRKRMRET
jgi:hypothetical protein